MVSNPGSSGIELPEIKPPQPPTPSANICPPLAQPLLPPPPTSSTTSPQDALLTNGSDRSISDALTGTTIVPNPAISPYPPPSFDTATAVAPEPGLEPELVQVVDEDVVQYNRAHGHGDTAIARRTSESFPGHEYEQSLRLTLGPPESLPEYSANELPRYTRYDHGPRNRPGEPQTLARLFFKFGFFFPAFWIFGSLMLITPLRSPNPLNQDSVWPPNTAFVTWCNEHLETEEEKAAFMAKFQEAEMKWAKRCLLASFILVCFCIAFGAMIFGVLKSTAK